MSKVARIELYHVAIPLPARFYPSWIPGFPQTENRFTLVCVTTDDGVQGFSAGPAMGRERRGLGDLVGPYLLGEDATDLATVQQRIREIGYLGWKNHWIEPAFWDIAGKLAGKPVHELLRGAPGEPGPKTVRLYASTGEVKTVAARIAEAEARRAEGFDTIKLRVHDFDERVDIAHVTETARALGDTMRIGVDANQGWRVTVVSDAPLWDLGRAKRFCDACADAGIAWVEEPLAMDDYDGLVALCDHSRVPLSGGEIHSSGLPELRMMIERGCYDVYQPDAVFAGGMAQALEVSKLCRARGLGFTPHTWTNGIGFAVNLQVFAASGFAGEHALEYPFNPPGWTVEARDGILETPFAQRRGELELPTLPGLGFRIDAAALRRHGQRFAVMDRKRLAWFSLRERGISVSLEIEKARKARHKAKA
ncbi:MAG: mandelate racemase/muconate lactonizing enzyme family protein, partial [Polyangiaceae bacterium]|nr:mandelate racemase/muconate lactonizing enzyme family protein [Polyangiaceae bacterium]